MGLYRVSVFWLVAKSLLVVAVTVAAVFGFASCRYAVSFTFEEG